MVSSSFSVAIIGGGIAGISAAYNLSIHPADPQVTLFEAESELAQHSTGRSAAQFIRGYGARSVRALTAASYEFFSNPPEELNGEPLLAKRGHLSVAAANEEQQLAAEVEASAGSLQSLTIIEAQQMFPPLRAERFVAAAIEPNSTDIDVAGLHQLFVRGFASAGGAICRSSRVVGLERQRGGGWRVSFDGTDSQHFDVVVNAAGAWDDEVARIGGLEPIGLVPMRRTAFTVGVSSYEPAEVKKWPLVAPVGHPWYVKPDGAQLLCSPANEDPMQACDVKHEELDVAIAIDRINADTTLAIRSIRSAWAGLRTFTPDREMVIGPDPVAEDFFWLAGQGGTGIQTAPAAAELVAGLILDASMPQRLESFDVDVESMAPDRFSA